MSIKQFNGNWVSHEDRLMFRFNTHDNSEFRFWITRLVAKTLIAGSQHLVKKALEQKHEPGTAQAIQDFQQQHVKQQADFKVPYQEAAALPLGDQPVLVTGLKMRPEGELMSIDFELATQKNLNMKLTLPMLQTMIILLDRLQEMASWGVGLTEQAAQKSSVVLTDTASGEGPESGGGKIVH
jgi:hypothetical protein